MIWVVCWAALAALNAFGAALPWQTEAWWHPYEDAFGWSIAAVCVLMAVRACIRERGQ